MISIIRCLLRQSLKQRMTKSALIWDNRSRLYEGDELRKVLDLPKGLPIECFLNTFLLYAYKIVF